MDRRPGPSNARSLNTRLDNLCAARGIPPGRGRRLVGIVIVGQLLAETQAGVVKGASSIEMRVGTDRSRVSSDLDTVRRATLERYRGDLERALRAGWHGFTGILRDLGAIATPAPVAYRPHRFRLKLVFRGGDFTSFTLEVSPEEVSSFAEQEVVPANEAAEWFAELGLPEPAPVPVLPLPHQVAQKLHACTAPDRDEWINDRSHDLVDLQLAMDGYETATLTPFRIVAERLFASRRMHAWPPTVTPRRGWELIYPQQASGLGVHTGLTEAVAWTNELIHRIARS